MHAVIFEVQPNSGKRQAYLDIAAELRNELEKIDGFISIERFESLTNEGKILSLSFWRDADAVAKWRRNDRHHDAQLAGRAEIFADYRITVVEVVRQYSMRNREQAPQAMPPVPSIPN